MKSFQSFRLDTANQCLWRGQERVPIAPKAFDVLRYLVENPGRLVTQDEVLEKLWPETYVNPEVFRKYILDIRKILGDRPDKPEFIETVTKRGYRFIAPVIDDDATLSQDLATQKQESAPEPAAALQIDQSRTHFFQRFAIIAILGVVVAVAIAGHFWFARGKATRSSPNANSIAVLPFADLSPGKDQEYFSDGLSEQLINDLAKVSGVKVVGRSSAFQFKGRNEDLREVGSKLGVANVLEGSVRRDGNRVRITAELIKTDDGFQLWSQTYDREINDIFAVQDEIARAATEALQLKLLGSNGQPVPSNLRSANPEAYQAFLQAQYFSALGESKEDMSKALAYTDQAIKLDQKYAPAWALRSSVQTMMAEVGVTEVTEGFRSARHDAEQAIALDSTSAPAYLALAKIQIDGDWDWDGAATSVTKAANLEPGSAEIFRLRSYLSRESGNLREAIRLEEQAVALDPLRPDFHLCLGYLLYVAGRYGEAQVSLQKALDLNPQAAFVHLTLGKILIAEGKPQQSLAEIEKEPLEWGKLTGQILAYHALSREKDSNAALAGLIASYDTGAGYQIAQVYAYRGESDKSFEWLERAYKQRDAGVSDIKTDPLFKSLRHDPRYTEFLKKMRLPT
ncbi:MAG TPA: winged helix-turn-helix domain-containing protein [Candidatus Binatia bacterium]|nr:winged helix-turn-helix domain-containing protein [Candidatus Binatia bacterium]